MLHLVDPIAIDSLNLPQILSQNYSVNVGLHRPMTLDEEYLVRFALIGFSEVATCSAGAYSPTQKASYGTHATSTACWKALLWKVTTLHALVRILELA